MRGFVQLPGGHSTCLGLLVMMMRSAIQLAMTVASISTLLLLGPPVHGAPSCKAVFVGRLLLGEPVNRLQYRFDRVIEDIWGAIGSASNAAEAATNLSTSKMRARSFFIEAVLKELRHASKEEHWEEILAEQFKPLEDKIGLVIDRRDFVEQVEKDIVDGKVAASLLDPAQERLVEASVGLAEFLKKNGWLEKEVNPMIDLLAFAGERKAKQKKDRAQVLEYMDNYVKKILEEKWDFTQLEGDVGVHELRRRIRWILITMQAYDGLFGLGKDSPRTPEMALDQNLAKKYGIPIANPEAEPNPVIIATNTFAHLSAVNEFLSLTKGAAATYELVKDAVERLRQKSPGKRITLESVAWSYAENVGANQNQGVMAYAEPVLAAFKEVEATLKDFQRQLRDQVETQKEK